MAPISRPERAAWQLQRAAAELGTMASTVLGQRSRRSPALDLATAILVMLRLHRLARANVLDIGMTEIELVCPTLPPRFDGYTLLHLSDFHVGFVDGLVERAAALVRGQTVDLAVLTGDVQTRGWPNAARAVGLLEPLLGAVDARDGILAVLGNHDSYDLPDHLEARGIQVLVNEHAEVRRDDQRIHIAGTDDVRYFFTETALHTLRARPPGFSIALIHSPELAAVAATAGYALYLTGHTHGGQIALPGGRPIFTATVAHQRLSSGGWQLGGMHGYTSRGIGTGPVAIRWNCPAEITRIRLRRDPARSSGPPHSAAGGRG